MTQLTQEAKSMARMANEYVTDAGEDTELKDFWMAYAKEKEKHIEDLKTLIAKHMQ